MTIFRFEDYELDTDRSELSDSSGLIKLEPQVVSILEMLVKNHAKIVSRDVFIERIWGGRIVSNAVIDSRIRAVRAAIGDDGRAQRLIKTYPNRGYKFVGEVTTKQTNPPIAKDQVAPSATTASQPKPFKLGDLFPRRLTAWTSVAAAFLVALAIGGYTLDFGVRESVNASALPSSVPSAELAILEEREDPLVFQIALAPVSYDEDTTTDLRAVALQLSAALSANFSAFDNVEFSIVTSEAFAELEGGERSLAEADQYFIELALAAEDERPLLIGILSNKSQNSTLWSNTYPGRSDQESTQVWIDRVSQNITLATINRLGISATSMRAGSGQLAVYGKYWDGIGLLRQSTAESLDAGLDLFEQLAEDEPEFLLGLAGLFDAHWFRLNFGGAEIDTTLPRMASVLSKMQAISPRSAETLTAEAILEQIEGNTFEVETKTPMSNLLTAVNSAPDYLRAHEELGHLYYYRGLYSEAVQEYNKSLSELPTCPILLAAKSRSLMCGGMTDEALSIAHANVNWNPDNEEALAEFAKIALDRGHYDKVQRYVQLLTRKESLGYAASSVVVDWYLRLGDYSTAERYAFSSIDESYIAALKGEFDRAETLAEEHPGYFLSSRAKQLMGVHEPMQKRIKVIAEEQDSFYQPEFEISNCDLFWAAYEGYVLHQIGHPLADVVISNLERYYEDNPIEEFKNESQFLGLMGLRVMQDNPESALQILNKAIDAEYLFVNALQDPIYDNVRALEGYPTAEARLKQLATNWSLTETTFAQPNP